MVSKTKWEQIKNNPELHRLYIEKRRDYKAKRKLDPIRYARYLEMHKKEHKRSYLKNRDKIRLREKERYHNMPKDKKLEYRKRVKRYRINRRKIFVLEWGNKCQKCGYSEHPEILEFDHKTPLYRKTNGIKKRVSDHMLKEVKEHPELFELLCPNCHRLKTLNEISALWEMIKLRFFDK